MASTNLDLWNRYGGHLIPIMPFMDNVIVSAEGSYMTEDVAELAGREVEDAIAVRIGHQVSAHDHQRAE